MPVIVDSDGIVIAGVLRIGIHCGIEVVPSEAPGGFLGASEVGAGIEVAVVAHVAEFITNVTLAPDDEDCNFKVVQEYNLALGAFAGATIAANIAAMGITSQIWGPVIEKSTAIFTTTLGEVCAGSGNPRTTEALRTAVHEKRQDLTTTSLSSKIETSGVSCMLSGVANCPASMQKTTKTAFTTYHTTVVPSGVIATFPSSTFNTIQSTQPFGTRVKTIKAISGSPVAYTAPAGTHDEGSTQHDGKAASGAVNRKLAIGIGIGLGIPLLIAVVGAVM